MPASTTDQQIRAQIDAFIDQITTLVRAQAVEAVGLALGGEIPVPLGSKHGGGRRKATARKASGKRVRRSSADLGAVGEKVLAHVRANPGCSMTDVGEALGSSATKLRPAVQLLLVSKALRTTGQRRGTKYFAGGGSSAGAAPKAARRGRKKATRDKATRKTAKRKPAHKTAKKARRKVAKKTAKRATKQPVTAPAAA